MVDILKEVIQCVENAIRIWGFLLLFWTQKALPELDFEAVPFRHSLLVADFY